MDDLPREVATEERPAASLSGRYVLVVVTEWKGSVPLQGFQVLDRDGRVVFSPGERFDARHTTYFLWDEMDRVWVYSGDEGTLFWEYDQGTATWERRVYSGSGVPAPGFLKRVRPRWHRY